MKTDTTSVIGFNVPVSDVPTTLAELVAAAGGEQQLVEKTVGWAIAHNVNTSARAAICENLEDATSVARAVTKEPKKDKPGEFTEKWGESEQTYADRARAESKMTSEQIWDVIKDKVGSIPFKLVGEPRSGGPGRVGKEDAKHAETLIAAGQPTWTKALEVLTQKNPGLVIEMDPEGKPVLESLANAIKVNRQRASKEAAAEFMPAQAAA